MLGRYCDRRVDVCNDKLRTLKSNLEHPVHMQHLAERQTQLSQYINLPPIQQRQLQKARVQTKHVSLSCTVSLLQPIRNDLHEETEVSLERINIHLRCLRHTITTSLNILCWLCRVRRCQQKLSQPFRNSRHTHQRVSHAAKVVHVLNLLRNKRE